MLTILPYKFSINPIIEQVNEIGYAKRLCLNTQSGEFFNDPWKINPELSNTPLGEVLSALGDIGQARLLRLESGETYTAHTDPDDRIHMAIVTNPYSYLIDITDNSLIHIPADGQLWFMDTSKTHVAANLGPTTRVHLNIRVLLPHFDDNKPFIHFQVDNTSITWKQDSYIELMGFVNNGIKTGCITGFAAPDETNLFLNCKNPTIFDDIIYNIRVLGVKIDVIIG